MDICLHFPWVNIPEQNCWVIGLFAFKTRVPSRFTRTLGLTLSESARPSIRLLEGKINRVDAHAIQWLAC